MELFGSAITVVATCVLLLARKWQDRAVALGGHYAGITILLLKWASIELLSIELVLCITSAALVWLSAPQFSESKTRLLDDTPLSPFFQMLTLILCGLAALGFSNTYSIASNTNGSGLNFLFFWLATTGIMALSLTRAPFSVGCGLLFVLEAVQIAYLARVELPKAGSLFALVVVQFILIIIVVRAENHGVINMQKIIGDTNDLQTFKKQAFSRIPILLMLLSAVGLLVFVVMSSDPFISAIALTAVALLSALLMSRTDPTEMHALDRMKFVALVTVAGTCLQMATLLGGEFQITREPQMAKVIIGFIVIGITAFFGVYPFHWWLVELPGKIGPVIATTLVGVIYVLLLAYLLNMVGLYPWLLADERSQTILIGIGVIGLCAAALFALSRQDLIQLLMYTIVGHAGIIIAGIATGSYQGITGALVLLLNQILAMLTLLLCISVVAQQRGKTIEQVAFDDLPSLGRGSPIIAIGIAVSSLTLLGLPPFVGFLGRWMVYVEISRQNTYLAVLVIGASILSLLSFVPIFQRLTQGLDIGRTVSLEGVGIDVGEFVEPQSAPQRLVFFILLALPLATGIYPVPVLDAVAKMLDALQIAL